MLFLVSASRRRCGSTPDASRPRPKARRHDPFPLKGSRNRRKPQEIRRFRRAALSRSPAVDYEGDREIQFCIDAALGGHRRLPVRPALPFSRGSPCSGAILHRLRTRPLLGFGRATRAPQGPFTFVEEDTDGTQAKVTVTDAHGTVVGREVRTRGHGEVAANRLLWLLGYLGEEIHFVRKGIIRGAKGLRRAYEHIRDSEEETSGAYPSTMCDGSSRSCRR